MKSFASFLTASFMMAGLLNSHKALAESWAYAGADRFYFPTGGYRSQGVTSNGAQWFFSWRYGLERTASDYRELEQNFSLFPRKSGIPPSVEALGGNHIGDIDYYGGKIYAPIEDMPNFRHPLVAVYDAATLSHTGATYMLPQSDLTMGVPWIAVDGPKNLAYTAEWDPVVRLNAYRLSDFSPIGYIPLQHTLRRLQGAKVRGDFLYAASDNSAKSIYKISLIDGSVNELLQLGRWHDLHDGHEHEVEGLTFVSDANGETLNVLMVHGSQRNVFKAYVLLLRFTRVAP
jgi:hypothetical protein